MEAKPLNLYQARAVHVHDDSELLGNARPPAEGRGTGRWWQVLVPRHWG